LNEARKYVKNDREEVKKTRCAAAKARHNAE